MAGEGALRRLDEALANYELLSDEHIVIIARVQPSTKQNLGMRDREGPLSSAERGIRRLRGPS